MCGLISVYQLGYLQRRIALVLVQHESHSMAESFSDQPIAQMPHIPGPHALGHVSVHQLTEDRLYSIAVATDHRASSRPPFRRSLFELRLKVQTLLGQFLFEFWTPVVSIRQYGSRSSGYQLGCHSGLMDLGWRYGEADDDARPRYKRVHPKAVESLARDAVVSEASLSSEPLASVCASELADRDGETVNQFQRWVVSNPLEQTLPYHLFDAPEVSRLSDERGAMYPVHGWKEMGVVSSEVVEDGLVLAERQVLSDNLHSDSLTV